jgi:hypothetical protein
MRSQAQLANNTGLNSPRANCVKPAAVGIRAHSGWAAAVAVAGSLREPKILGRERIIVIDGDGPRANQPYHFAKELPPTQAKLHLERCAETSRGLAAEGLRAMSDRLHNEGFTIVGCAILTASGRPLPALGKILASHPMIHTAEGEFFRDAFADACAGLKLAVTRIRERELLDRATAVLHTSTEKVRVQLTSLGRVLGPPWTQDQKSAALAGWLVLQAAGKPRR